MSGRSRDGRYLITEFGATRKDQTADGRTVTRTIQAAIDACVAAGGGTVVVPPGVFVTGSIVLGSNVELHLSPGATLAGASDPAEYPVIESRYGGYVGFNMVSEAGSDRRPLTEAHRPLIYADGASDVSISGSGTIDGRGEPWWAMKREKRLTRARPCLVSFNNCERVTITGVRLVNSAAWTVHPTFCTDVRIRGVSIKNPANSPNTDGIDPDSCNRVFISDCTIDVGDDCIAIKSGNDLDGRTVGRPCENVVITNCVMTHGHGGVVIGSEISGGVRAVTVSNCVFDGTDRGIRIKSRRRRGGWAEDLLFSNIVMNDVWCPLVVNSYYHCGSDPSDEFIHGEAPQAVDETTPVFRDIRLLSITCRGASVAAGFLYGLPEMPIRRVSLRDVTVELAVAPDDPERVPAMALRVAPRRGDGFSARFVEELTLDGVRVAWAEKASAGEPFRFERSRAVIVDGAARGEDR